MTKINHPTLVDIHKPPKRDRPAFDVYIGRAQPYPGVDPRAKVTSKWHNPFTEKKWGERALVMYEVYIRSLTIDMQLYLQIAGEVISSHSDNPYIKQLSQDEFEFIKKMVDKNTFGWDRKYNKSWEPWELSELTGKKLGCWCITTDSWENPDPPVCHGQVLMKLWHEACQKGELDDS